MKTSHKQYKLLGMSLVAIAVVGVSAVGVGAVTQTVGASENKVAITGRSAGQSFSRGSKTHCPGPCY